MPEFRILRYKVYQVGEQEVNNPDLRFRCIVYKRVIFYTRNSPFGKHCFKHSSTRITRSIHIRCTVYSLLRSNLLALGHPIYEKKSSYRFGGWNLKVAHGSLLFFLYLFYFWTHLAYKVAKTQEHSSRAAILFLSLTGKSSYALHPPWSNYCSRRWERIRGAGEAV